MTISNGEQFTTLVTAEYRKLGPLNREPKERASHSRLVWVMDLSDHNLKVARMRHNSLAVQRATRAY